MSSAVFAPDSEPTFPDFLLSDVLDYLHLSDLLLAAMPVNRYWQQSVIGHPCYWYNLELTRDAHDSVLTSPALFILRLSRTGARPIRVRVHHADPGAAVFLEVARHLSQIKFLFLQTSLDHVGEVIDALGAHQAPLLETFCLHPWPPRLHSSTGNPDPIVMPADLFASTTPLLDHVAISEIELAPQFPAFLKNVTSFSYSIGPMSHTQHQLPNVFLECPHLQTLTLQGSMVLEDPAFAEASNWERLSEVTFNIFDFDPNQLPTRGVRSVIYHAFYRGTNTVIGAAQHLTGPLSLAFHRLLDVNRRDSFIRITMRSTVKQTSHERQIDTRLPDPPPGTFPFDTVAAFQNVPLVGTFVRLVLAVSDWDRLVGLGYLAGFPALEDLVITVVYWPPHTVWNTPDANSRLSCPRLQRLILRRQRWSQRGVVEVAAVASFATASLPDARFPLKLELNEVALDGSWKDFPAVFSGCEERELTDVDDNL